MSSSAGRERAGTKAAGSAIRTGKMTVHLEQRLVTVDGNPVRLTPKEYEVLELLSLRKGTVLTKEMFLNHLYGGKDEPEIKIIDVFVCDIRKRLAQATGGHDYIETVWGRGYVLRDVGLQPAANAAEIGKTGGKSRRPTRPTPA